MVISSVLPFRLAVTHSSGYDSRTVKAEVNHKPALDMRRCSP